MVFTPVPMLVRYGVTSFALARDRPLIDVFELSNTPLINEVAGPAEAELMFAWLNALKIETLGETVKRSPTLIGHCRRRSKVFNHPIAS